MNREEHNYRGEDNINEALDRFRKSLVNGRKSYFDVSEFEGIVEHLMDEGDLQGSEIAARQGIQIHPGALPLQLKYAQVLMSRAKYQSALKYMEMAERLEMTNPDVHLMKGSALLMLGKVKLAEQSFRKALKYAGSERDEFLYNIGSAYIQANDAATAITYFERTLELNPLHELALNDLGFFCDQEGDFEKSINYYDRSLDIDPFNFSIWFNLGITHNKAGNFTKAIESYEYAHILNEHFDQALFNIGNACANAGRFKDAIDKYLEYLEREPDNDDAWCYIGECYLNLDDTVKSRFHYRKAVKLNPGNDTAWFGIALIMWSELKLKESAAHIRKALRIDPSNPEYWITLAKVYSELLLFNKAVRALDEAALLDPSNAELWLTWCELHLLQDDPVGALEILERGAINSDSSLIRYRMVGMLLEAKRRNEAYEMLEQALEADFLQVNYLFDIYPNVLKNKKMVRMIDRYRDSHSMGSTDPTQKGW